MRGLARVVLIGNLTQDPEEFSAGCKFGVAVNGKVKQGDEWVERASFFQVTVFGKQAEIATKYLSKGSPVAIDGRLHQDRWTTDGGDNRSAVKVISENLTLISTRDGQGGGQSDAPPAQASDPAPTGPPSDDDIPFARPRIPDFETRRRDVFAGDRWVA